MKKIYLVALGLFATVSFAQVKVGNSPIVNPNAMFEVEATNKGMLLPRVELIATNSPAPLAASTPAEIALLKGMTVYNTAETDPATTTLADRYRVSPGFYYHDGEKWNEMITRDNKAVKFFYMPSISFSATAADVGQTFNVNLYEEYKGQFNAPKVKSASATTNNIEIPYFGKATDLYYFVTDYDEAVFEDISIDDNGEMTYKVKAEAQDCSLINIVFVVK